ncbi:MAG: hypothetical protein AAF787_23920 [Chloroflexota bacterium]
MRILLNIVMVLLVFVLIYVMLFTGLFAIWNIGNGLSGDAGMSIGLLYAAIAVISARASAILMGTLIEAAQQQPLEQETRA